MWVGGGGVWGCGGEGVPLARGSEEGVCVWVGERGCGGGGGDASSSS